MKSPWKLHWISVEFRLGQIYLSNHLTKITCSVIYYLVVWTLISTNSSIIALAYNFIFTLSPIVLNKLTQLLFYILRFLFHEKVTISSRMNIVTKRIHTISRKKVKIWLFGNCILYKFCLPKESFWQKLLHFHWNRFYFFFIPFYIHICVPYLHIGRQ